VKRLAAAAVVLLFASVAAAARDPKQEAAVDAEVAAVDPALVAKVHAANDAVDHGDDAAAVKAYAEVHERAPKVVAVTRRLGTAEARVGKIAAAIAHCREALAEESSAENHAALAVALASGAKPLIVPDDAKEAVAEAHAALAMAPNAGFSQTTACEVAAAVGDADMLDACSARLRQMDPNGQAAHFFTALSLGHRREIDDAERELDAARAAGLSARVYDETRVTLEHARPKPAPLATGATVAGVGWVILVFVLLVGGMLLSDASERAPSAPVRALQRGALVLAVVLFPYTAILFSLALIAVVGFTAVAFLGMAHASMPVHVGFGLLALYVVIAASRALLAKVPERDAGAPVDLGAERKLRKALDRVVAEIGTKPVTAVYARPDAGITVIERGGPFGHLFGRNELALVVGVGALDGMTRGQFCALVASELGKHRARGAGGGDLAIVERASIDALAERMEARGVATGANPAWWVVALHRAFFTRISEGAVALQETLADGWAAKAFGGEALARAIEHVATRGVEFDARARGSIRDAIDGDGPSDLYARPIEGDVRGAVDDALEAQSERIERIEALPATGKAEKEDDDKPAWSLFSDREALEAAMNERVRRELRELAGFGAAEDQASSESSVARA